MGVGKEVVEQEEMEKGGTKRESKEGIGESEPTLQPFYCPAYFIQAHSLWVDTGRIQSKFSP